MSYCLFYLLVYSTFFFVSSENCGHAGYIFSGNIFSSNVVTFKSLALCDEIRQRLPTDQ